MADKDTEPEKTEEKNAAQKEGAYNIKEALTELINFVDKHYAVQFEQAESILN